MDFHTPTEEVDVSVKQEEIPPLKEDTTSYILESVKSTEELPEPTQPNQSTKGGLQAVTSEFELTDQIRKEDLPPEECSGVPHQTITSSEVAEDATELESANSTGKFQEALKYEKQEPPKTTELSEPEKTVISEPSEKKVVEVTGEEPFKVVAEETIVTETFQEPDQVLPHSR